MQPEAHRERVIMRTSLAGAHPGGLADERSARQIVRNLLSNAVKFNEPGGQVIVSTALGDGGTVLLRVRDTGVGMTRRRDRRGAGAVRRLAPPQPANGNGLGLPLTRALVGANGASMAIRSRPREGTLVEVAFRFGRYRRQAPRPDAGRRRPRSAGRPALSPRQAMPARAPAKGLGIGRGEVAALAGREAEPAPAPRRTSPRSPTPSITGTPSSR